MNVLQKFSCEEYMSLVRAKEMQNCEKFSDFNITGEDSMYCFTSAANTASKYSCESLK